MNRLKSYAAVLEPLDRCVNGGWDVWVRVVQRVQAGAGGTAELLVRPGFGLAWSSTNCPKFVANPPREGVPH